MGRPSCLPVDTELIEAIKAIKDRLNQMLSMRGIKLRVTTSNILMYFVADLIELGDPEIERIVSRIPRWRIDEGKELKKVVLELLRSGGQ